MSDLSGFSMFELFKTEVENNAKILNDGLLGLEEKGGCGEVCEPLMRAAHSIKGAARIIGLDAGVELAHKMEDCFVTAQKGNRVLNGDDIDVLLGGVDMLVRISQGTEKDAAEFKEKNLAKFEKLIQSLADVNAGKYNSANTPAAQSTAPESAQQPTLQPSVTPAAPQPQPSPEASPQNAHTSDKPTTREIDADRVVRVTSSSMDYLLGLAGEAYVQSQWFEPFGDVMQSLRRENYRLSSQLEAIFEAHEREQHELAKAILRDAQHHLRNIADTIASQVSSFNISQRRMGNLTERLYNEVIRSRMRPFSDGTGGFPRMVRDLAKRVGKKVRFEIHGQDTEIDRDILEKLESPLTHLLRNAVDHGLELPEERIAANKNETGNLTLEASHRAGMLHIEIRDDGRGVDIEVLRGKIVSKGLATQEMADQMTKPELLEFLFLPGFSTRDKVTEISGRGVGLDVLQTMIQEVGGTVTISTQAAQGTVFHMQLPLTLSVIRSLLIEIAGEPYAIPLYRVDRCVIVNMDEIKNVENRQYIEVNGENIGLVSAQQILDLPEVPIDSEQVHIVTISDRSDQYGLQVSRFLGERDLVVRPLDLRLGKVPDISAAAIMEDGSPLLILDADDVVRSAQALLTTGRLRSLRRNTARSDEAQTRKRILVVDDSITVREVQRRLLESAGYEVEVAVDGADGWNAIRSSQFDMLISDIDMPRMNGIELVRHVKQDVNLKDIPVMIVSYKDREEDRLNGLEAGADYYLTKSSFHDDTLLEAVEDLIGSAAE
ncbi:MAG TPA: hybrid sensor histidine kinase/response regulator [Phycisphaerae bacterium]|nr:hybrid sensor histidine kinase/response regulator [Phycisphaerae bacterium]